MDSEGGGGVMELTKAELDYLIGLIEDNEQNHEYYGNEEQYWKRVKSVKDKIRKLYHESEATNNV
jgi:hypothetical protein